MKLDRDETIRAFACALVASKREFDINDPRPFEEKATGYADTLLAHLAPKVEGDASGDRVFWQHGETGRSGWFPLGINPGCGWIRVNRTIGCTTPKVEAPPPYVPKVGDVVRWRNARDERLVVGLASGGDYYFKCLPNPTDENLHGVGNVAVFIRPATPEERKAAGLDAAPTPPAPVVEWDGAVVRDAAWIRSKEVHGDANRWSAAADDFVAGARWMFNRMKGGGK